jgi:hypothetical protein
MLHGGLPITLSTVPRIAWTLSGAKIDTIILGYVAHQQHAIERHRRAQWREFKASAASLRGGNFAKSDAAIMA